MIGKKWRKGIVILALGLLCIALTGNASFAAKDQFGKIDASAEYSKMPDMSDFDPNNPVIPHGDTIKIAIVAPFSGPAAVNGQIDFIAIQWAAHAVNKKGGILVDGKKKLVEVIKADNMSNPDATKKVCERMVLHEKVHVLMGTQGSHLMKIINLTARKYNVLAVDFAALSDELMDAQNFSANSFMTCMSVSQIGRGLAYYYGQIRKKEKKFYIICQDYSFGRGLGESFKKGIKEYYPEAQIVGEDYHKLFLTDYAPFLTKIKASGAEVIYTGDWPPDVGNLMKQARQMGIKIVFAGVYMDDVVSFDEIGVEGTEGTIYITQYGQSNPGFKTKDEIRYSKMWNDLWKKKWKSPYTATMYEWPLGNIGHYAEQTMWMLSVMERAGSVKPEKVIKVWEGDTYRFLNGKVVKMRACDHKIIQNFHVYEYVRPEKQKVSMNIPPYTWSTKRSAPGPVSEIPAEKVLSWMDQKLDRCKGKNEWGE
ncbi:MAG TPA: ABC transporter substrate-binding protein [Smithellaceae bacterium]|nr:ABC transporter substrate-binding protein [Smithellaceae bacterium]